MSNLNTVDVFLGSEQVDDTERQFLRRLERDLRMRGTSAFVLANVEPPPKCRQTDFVIVTGHRTVVCELKAATAPLAGGPNGPWRRSQGGVETQLPGNPYRQAQDQVYGLSDAMAKFARGHDAPRSSRSDFKYFRDVDTVVCCYPEIPAGSMLEKHPFVTAVGYEQLLVSLTRPGPRVPWDREVFEAFVRWLGLYRQEEDLPAGRLRAANVRIVDEYRGRFLSRHPAAPGIVPTRAATDGVAGERPDLAAMARTGTPVVVRGASGLGKTVWLRETAQRIAEAGDVPVWIEAVHAEASFRTTLARSVAPLTVVSAAELLQAAQAAGRAVVFLVDGLNEADAAVQAALIDGVHSMALRAPGRTAVVTAQNPVTGLPKATDVTLAFPDADERRAILRALGGDERVAEIDAFRTPLDLAIAAECAGGDAAPATTLDLYIRARAGDEPTRAGLRAIAWQMHQDTRLSILVTDALRLLHRRAGLEAEVAERVLANALLDGGARRIRFAHERFATFLAAEHIGLAETNPDVLAARLAEPRNAGLRADVLALERDDRRLIDLLGWCQDDRLLTDAARGDLGADARRAARALIEQTLRLALTRTTANALTLACGPDNAWHGPLTLEGGPTPPADHVRLAAAGHGLHRGDFTRLCVRLLEETDAAIEASIDETLPGRRDRVAASLAIGQAPPDAAPAVHLLRGVQSHYRAPTRDSGLAARTLDALTTGAPGAARLLAAAGIARSSPNSDAIADLARACVTHGSYHLRLDGLQLALRAHACTGPVRDRLLAAIQALPDDNPFVNGSILEALAALGAITTSRTVEDIVEEVRTALSQPDEGMGQRLARGIVSSIFEEESIVGPYYAAVDSLEPNARRLLLALSVGASEVDDMTTVWVLGELAGEGPPSSQTGSAARGLLARSEPSRWFMPQMGMQATVAAAGIVANDPAWKPGPLTAGTPPWESFLQLIVAALRDESGEACSDELDLAWEAVEADRAGTAELVARLSPQWTGAFGEGPDVEAILAARRVERLSALLEWALEHPDDLRPPMRAMWDSRSSIIAALGRVGRPESARLLRGHLDDPALGGEAVQALRALDRRHSSEP